MKHVLIPFLPGKSIQEKYKSMCSSKKPFPDSLTPNPENKCCPCGHKFCSKQSAIDRYLVISDKVHIHDILPVDDSRNSVCRVFYLDTTPAGMESPACECHLSYYTISLFPINGRVIQTGGQEYKYIKYIN